MSNQFFCPKCNANLIEGSKFCDMCGAKIDWGNAHNVVPNTTNTKSSNISIVGIVVAFVVLIAVAVAGTVVIYKTFASNKKGSQNSSIAMATTEVTEEEPTTEEIIEVTTEDVTTTEVVESDVDSTVKDEEDDCYLGIWEGDSDISKNDNTDYILYKFVFNENDYQVIIPYDCEETYRSEDNDYAEYTRDDGARIVVEYVSNDSNWTPKSVCKKYGKKEAGSYGKIHGDPYEMKGDDWATASYYLKGAIEGKDAIYYAAYNFSKDKSFYTRVTLIYPKSLADEYDPGPTSSIASFVDSVK